MLHGIGIPLCTASSENIGFEKFSWTWIRSLWFEIQFYSRVWCLLTWRYSSFRLMLFGCCIHVCSRCFVLFIATMTQPPEIRRACNSSFTAWPPHNIDPILLRDRLLCSGFLNPGLCRHWSMTWWSIGRDSNPSANFRCRASAFTDTLPGSIFSIPRMEHRRICEGVDITKLSFILPHKSTQPKPKSQVRVTASDHTLLAVPMFHSSSCFTLSQEVLRSHTQPWNPSEFPLPSFRPYEKPYPSPHVRPSNCSIDFFLYMNQSWRRRSQSAQSIQQYKPSWSSAPLPLVSSVRVYSSTIDSWI